MDLVRRSRRCPLRARLQRNKLIAGTKFAHFPGYSKYHVGHISLQGTEPKGEPGDKLWFRNIMIKKLN